MLRIIIIMFGIVQFIMIQVHHCFTSYQLTTFQVFQYLTQTVIFSDLRRLYFILGIELF